MEEPAATSDVPVMPTEAKPRSLPEWTKVAVVAGILVMLMALLIWSMNRNAAKEYQALFGRSVDGLSAALQQAVIDRRPERLTQTLQRVAKASGVTLISVTDTKGFVISSSSPDHVGKSYTVLAKPPLAAKVIATDDGLEGYRAIVLGSNNVIGGLIVVSN